jgi:hypothetical protein
VKAATTYTHFIWECLFQVDRGQRSLDIVETVRRCSDRTIIEWLQNTTDMDLSLILSHEGRAAYEQLVDLFENLSTVDHSRKFGVEHDGFHLLIAFCTEGIQRLGT